MSGTSGSSELAHVYAVVEVGVRLLRFINVEMRSQGWYAVRARLKPHPRIKAAWPYLAKFHDGDPHAGLGPATSLNACVEPGWSWRSHVFRIQFVQDTVNFEEPWPAFQVFLRQPSNLDGVELSVELELLAQPLAPEQLDQPCQLNKMKAVAKQVLSFPAASSGLLSYHAASWGVDYWGMCHVGVAACLMGYVTRANMHSMSQALGRDLRKARHARKGSMTSISRKGSIASNTSGSFTHGAPSSPLSSDTLLLHPLQTPAAFCGAACVSTVGGDNCLSPFLQQSRNADAVYSPAESLNGPLSVASLVSADSLDLASPHAHDPDHVKPRKAKSLLQVLQMHAAHASTAIDNAEPKASAGFGKRFGVAGSVKKQEQQPQPPDALFSIGVTKVLDQLFRDFVMPLRDCLERMRGTLRSLPRSCYHPQTYDSMYSLVKNLPAPSHRTYANLATSSFSPRPSSHSSLTNALSTISTKLSSSFRKASSLATITVGNAMHAQHAQVALSAGATPCETPRSPAALTEPAWPHDQVHHGSPLQRLKQQSQQHAGMGSGHLLSQQAHSSVQGVHANVSSWDTVPTTVAGFLAKLPHNTTPSNAVVYLHAVMIRLMQETLNEWSVAQWLLEHCTMELFKHLRCQWEQDQAPYMNMWTTKVSDLSKVQSGSVPGGELSVGTLAGKAYVQLKQNPPKHKPLVFLRSIWSHPDAQPVLLIDDSLGSHFSQRCSSSKSSASLQVPPTSVPPSRLCTGIKAGVSSTGGGCGSGLPPDRVSLSGISIMPKDSQSGSVKEDDPWVHMVVFVHGYKGIPMDLGPIKANLHALYPSVHCCLSSANVNKTSDSLPDMGSRLADEVIKWVKDLPSSYRASQKQQLSFALVKLGRISFVGHSLGGLVIRAALANPKMKLFLPKLWMYMSVGTPHLGQLFSSNGLLAAGVGVLKVFQKGGSLQQLDLDDAPGSDPRSAYLYQLATTGGVTGGGRLQSFKRVVLLSCAQDGYVPFHSAELTMCDAALKDKSSMKSQLYAEMVQASTQGFGTSPDSPQMLRVGVHFPASSLQAGLFDDVLGRAAHVALISNDDLARSVAWGVIQRYKLIDPEEDPAWLS